LVYHQKAVGLTISI